MTELFHVFSEKSFNLSLMSSILPLHCNGWSKSPLFLFNSVSALSCVGKDCQEACWYFLPPPSFPEQEQNTHWSLECAQSSLVCCRWVTHSSLHEDSMLFDEEEVFKLSTSSSRWVFLELLLISVHFKQNVKLQSQWGFQFECKRWFSTYNMHPF